MTLVFSVPDSEDEEAVIKHIEEVTNRHQKFQVHLKDLVKAWDHWLFLTPEEGRNEVIKLHDALYSGILAQYLRTDIEFIPHVSLGLFTQKDQHYTVFNPTQVDLDQALYNKALTEAENLNFDYSFELDRLFLIKLNEQRTKILTERQFKLGKN